MPKAIVIGAGTAGPAAAQLLAQQGWEASLFDARDDLDASAGLFLNVAVNGRRVLDRLGVGDRLMTDAHPAGQIHISSGRGKHLATVPNGPGGRPGDGGVIVRRGWLQRVLWDAAAAAGVHIRPGSRLTDLTTEPDTVTAHFADGHVEQGDIVIGADGVGSLVRRHIAPAVAPQFTGLIGTGGFAKVPGLAPTPGAQHMVFGARSFFGYLVRDDGTVYWFANLTADRPARTGGADEQSTLERLVALHADDPDPVPRILAYAHGAVGEYPIFRLGSVPRWWSGRVIAIGDAVHATSPSAGQGASLALEDAAELAAALRAHSDHRRAFATFEQTRRRRAERIVAYAAAIDRQKRASKNRAVVAARDALLPLFLKNAAKSTRYDWVFDYAPPLVGAAVDPI